MNKRYCAAVAGTIATLGLPATMTQAQQPINVTVDGDVVAFGAQRPVEQFGTVLVPLRGVFEKLGATVAYDAGTRTILAVRGATNVSLKLGSRDAQVNDTSRTLSVPAQAVNGTTLVPLRFVSEALGAQVNWQAVSRTVIVSTTGGSTAGASIPSNPSPSTTGEATRDNPYTYGRIVFDWDLNGLSLPNRALLEDQIRRNLNANSGSPLVRRRSMSNGTLDVNVTLSRVDQNYVRADVKLGLDRNGRGASAITAAESATAVSRDNNVDGQVVLQAFRKARREFGTNLNQFSRTQPNNR